MIAYHAKKSGVRRVKKKRRKPNHVVPISATKRGERQRKKKSLEENEVERRATRKTIMSFQTPEVPKTSEESATPAPSEKKVNKDDKKEPQNVFLGWLNHWHLTGGDYS